MRFWLFSGGCVSEIARLGAPAGRWGRFRRFIRSVCAPCPVKRRLRVVFCDLAARGLDAPKATAQMGPERASTSHTLCLAGWVVTLGRWGRPNVATVTEKPRRVVTLRGRAAGRASDPREPVAAPDALPASSGAWPATRVRRLRRCLKRQQTSRRSLQFPSGGGLRRAQTTLTREQNSALRYPAGTGPG